MSDPSHVSVICRKRDQKVFEALGLKPSFEQENKDWLVLETTAAEHGLYDELTQIADRGVPFLATQGPGTEYGGVTWAAMTEFAVCPTLHDSGSPVIEFQESGLVTSDLTMAVKYWDLRTKLRKLFGITESEIPW